MTDYSGGWGPGAVNGQIVYVPTKDVVFVNNVVVNPASEGAKWSHFLVSVSTGFRAEVDYPNTKTVTSCLEWSIASAHR